MANNATPTQGSLVEVESVPGSGTFDTPVGEVANFTGPSSEKAEIDVTHLQSTAMEYIPGLADFGSVEATMNFTIPEDTGQALLRSNFEGAGNAIMGIQITMTGKDGATQRRATGEGFVMGYPMDVQANSKADQSFTFRMTGPLVWSVPP